MAGTALFALAFFAATPPAQTTPYEFVRTYLSQLGTLEALRKSAAEDNDRDRGDSTKVAFDCVHYGTSYDLEISSAIRVMEATRLKAKFGTQSFAEVPGDIAKLYRQRQQTMQGLTKICSIFAAGPKDGVDYQGLAALMPQLRAQLEFLDKTAYESTVLVFSALISDKEDAEGNTSSLVINCSQKDELVKDIEASFSADDLKMKNPPWGIAQAQLFHEKLNEFSCFSAPK